MSTRRIGILGGTFDPIHNGHLDVAEAAETALGLTQVYVIPSKLPPHRRQPAASAFQRYAMVVLALAKRPSWRASDMELRSDGPSFTSDTLARFHERGYRRDELFFVVGADAFVEIGAWHDYPHILDAANFAVVSRPGLPVAELPDRLPDLAGRMAMLPGAGAAARDRGTVIFLIDAPTADVSATAIRARRQAGERIDGLVPPIVQQYIEQHGLYSPRLDGRRGSDAPSPAAAGRLHDQKRQPT